MATIIVKRSSETFNRMREITLELDGKLLGSISSGETREFTIQPGKHTFKSELDWCSSPEIELDLEETETKVLELNSFAYNKPIATLAVRVAPLIMAAVLLFMFLDVSPIIGYSLTVATLIPFLYLVYMLTFGRKNYLNLTLK